jgi:hypothetical protein
MAYKVLPCPENLPILNDINSFIISGTLAEGYKKGELSDILESDYKDHRAVGNRMTEVEHLQPITDFKESEIVNKEIVEKD